VAHVKRLDTGRWQARYRDLERREHARNFRTKIEAQRWLDSVTAAQVRGDYVDPKAGRTPFGTFAEEWYGHTATLKPSTRADYRSLLDAHVLPRWGSVQLRSITRSTLQTWVAEMARTRSASTTRRALGVVRGVLDVAIDDKALSVNVATGVRQPKLPKTERRYLTSDELDELADAMPTTRDRVLTLSLGWVGLRFGEAAALRLFDMDLLRRRLTVSRSATEVRGRIEIGTPKNGEERTVGMPAFLVDELSTYVASIAREGWLFPDAHDGPLHVTSWKRRVFDPAARAIQLTPPSLRVHDLRHTSASLAIAAGADVKKLQNQLGHSSATLTLDLYGHLYPDELEAFTDALDELRTRRAADSVRTPSDSASVVRMRT
jgi:integrase